MTLVKIAALGGIATVTMGLGLRFKINNNIKNSGFCKDALKTVRSHKGAIHLLGEPIKDSQINVSDSSINYLKENCGKYEIPLRGSKQRGVLHMWIARTDDKSDWVVQRLELGVSSEPNRRLIIKS